MPDLRLEAPEGYDPATQSRIAYMAAQLDDQLRRLKASVAGLEVPALEWQPEPGRNTVGMLLAHIAVAEAWWLNAGARGVTDRPEIEEIVTGVIGIRPQDDGMPMPSGSAHAEVLSGRTLADYLAMIDGARAASHAVLRSWRDADLETTVDVRDRKITLGWMLYHVHEHMIAHYGQILLLLRMLRERGLVPEGQQE